MKKVLSLIYYYLYRADFTLHLLSKNINPFYYLSRMLDKNRNIKVTDQVDVAFKNPRYGLSSIRAGGIIVGILGMIFWGIFSWILYLIGLEALQSNFFTVFICVTISWIYTNKIFKNDQYLKCFKKASKFSNVEKTKWILFTILFVIGGFLFGIVSNVIIFYLMK